MQRPQALGLIALLVLISARASALEAQEDPRRQPGAGTTSAPPTAAQQEEARKRAEAEQEAARRRAEAELRAAEERVRAEAEKRLKEAEDARSRADKRKGEVDDAREKLDQLKRDADEARARAEQQQEEAEEARARAEKQLKDAEEEAERAEAAKDEPLGPEPSLNLPIRYFVYTAVLSGLGYATGFLSAGPERDLRNTAKHRTPDETLSLYRRARYGGLLSKGFYSLSGAVGGFAAYKTQSAVREYLTAKAQLEMQRQQRQARRPAGGSRDQDLLAEEVTRTLLVPPVPDSTEIVLPEPPPIQAGIFLGPSGDTSFSLSVRF